MQIIKCKLGIRDALHQLDLLSSAGSIEDSVMSPDGSVYHEHVNECDSFCLPMDLFTMNVILLVHLS